MFYCDKMTDKTKHIIIKWFWIILVAPFALLFILLLCVGLFAKLPSFEELEQMSSDVDKLTEEAKTETDRKYFQMAREQLDKILKSRK